MIISYQEEIFNFNQVSRISVESDTLIFHSKKSPDCFLPLGHNYRGAVEHIADYIVSAYENGTKSLNLSTYLSRLEKKA